MKFTAIYRLTVKLKTVRCRYLLKRRHMRQVAILRQKHPAII